MTKFIMFYVLRTDVSYSRLSTLRANLVQEGIAQFISARQLTNHPVAKSVWDRFLMRDKW
jgi:hypothetical protein